MLIASWTSFISAKQNIFLFSYQVDELYRNRLTAIAITVML